MSEERDEKAKIYDPKKWDEMRKEERGHVVRGKCPCGADHDMIDKSDKKRT